MTKSISDEIKNDSNGKFGRVFVGVISVTTFALLIATAYFATSYERGDGLSNYEREAIAIVAQQNDITVDWNETVETFNNFTVESQREHIILFSLSIDSVHDLITDSQSVIEQWKEIEAPEKHVNSYEIGLDALMAMQDGLILFEEYFQNSLDTMVADQIRADDASAKLTHAKALWQAAAEAAAQEG